MNLISILLDIGNIIFFLANFPGIVTAFKNRTNLSAISSKMLIGYMLATICFTIVGLLTGGYITAILGVINELIFGIELYWKKKHK